MTGHADRAAVDIEFRCHDREVLRQWRAWLLATSADEVVEILHDRLRLATDLLTMRERLPAGVCPFGKIEDCGDSGYHADRTFTRDPAVPPAPESDDDLPHDGDSADPVGEQFPTPYLGDVQLIAGS